MSGIKGQLYWLNKICDTSTSRKLKPFRESRVTKGSHIFHPLSSPPWSVLSRSFSLLSTDTKTLVHTQNQRGAVGELASNEVYDWKTRQLPFHEWPSGKTFILLRVPCHSSVRRKRIRRPRAKAVSICTDASTVHRSWKQVSRDPCILFVYTR